MRKLKTPGERGFNATWCVAEWYEVDDLFKQLDKQLWKHGLQIAYCDTESSLVAYKIVRKRGSGR